MNQGKYVYSQLTDFLPKRIFDGLDDKYTGDKYVKHFSCWNQLLSMVFGQLTGRDSLRDLAKKSSIVDLDFQLNIDGNIYTFGSTTIDLCLSIFWWAKFRTTKGGVTFPKNRTGQNSTVSGKNRPSIYLIELRGGYLDDS